MNLIKLENGERLHVTPRCPGFSSELEVKDEVQAVVTM